MIQLISPAKINLFLQVLRRGHDGYHELASLFQAIDLCDTMTIAQATQDKLQCDHPELPTDRTNLIWKAIDIFRQKTGLSTAVDIQLSKKIPMEAGLGGGSSNAATALWGINALLDYPVSTIELQSWAGEIGSDVAFFFSSGTAYCTGRGEKVRSLPPLSAQKIWVVKPQGGLSTPLVYKKLDAANLPSRDPLKPLAAFLAGSSKGSFFNDLEAPAFALMPSLLDLRNSLKAQGFEEVLLSGSGTAFFCLGNAIPAVEAVTAMPAHYLNRSLASWY